MKLKKFQLATLGKLQTNRMCTGNTLHFSRILLANSAVHCIANANVNFVFTPIE